jgi:transposase-like protein
MTQKIKRYTEVIKRQIVEEYEAGSSIHALQKTYGINGSGTITNWIRKYAKAGFRHELVYIQSKAEIDRIRELEKQVEELQQALGRMTLEKLKLESTLTVLQGADDKVVKKKGLPSSRHSSRKPKRNLEVE